MSHLLLFDTRFNRAHTGYTRAEVVAACPRVRIDCEARCAVIDGVPDTVSIGDDYSAEEFVYEVCKRAIEVLCRDYGFVLYRNVESI